MHQITLRMARTINRMELDSVEKATGIAQNNLIEAERDSRTLTYDAALKLQRLYKLPSLSMVFMGEDNELGLSNRRSGLDLLDVYIDFLLSNRSQAYYIMVWFEAVTSELPFNERILIQRILEELERKEKMKMMELKRMKRYFELMV